MKLLLKIVLFCLLALAVSTLTFCKKDKILKDAGARLQFSQDSVLFDTVFTTIGSATQHIEIRNKYSEKIVISSIQLQGGSNSQFIINVDGAKGTSFKNIEIAPHDSMYIFIQVNVNPTNSGSPVIITDAINFTLNGNQQSVALEAWGQDAYYHRPTAAITFTDHSYYAYSLASDLPNSYNVVNGEFVWKNDKPHVIYNWVVVDEGQKLQIQKGTQVYMNYKSGIWVYTGGQLQVLGQKGQEVVFRGARLEKDFADVPGQWDRIWINQGSNYNLIDYAIIKNAFIGVQCEYAASKDSTYSQRGQLTLTNTKIQNMSEWGVYGHNYRIFGYNNVVSNCQEYSLNLFGGAYLFSQCTFANYWSQDKPRDKPTVNIKNYDDTSSFGINLQIANSIIDGKLDNELNIDLKTTNIVPASAINYTFSNSWIKTSANTSNASIFINVRKGTKDDVLNYKDISTYNFEPLSTETRIINFTGTLATQDANLISPAVDINGKVRNTTNVTAGAYETQ